MQRYSDDHWAICPRCHREVKAIKKWTQDDSGRFWHVECYDDR